MQARDLSACPSFDTYSTSAHLAARVLAEDSPALRSNSELTDDDSEFEFEFEFPSLSANPDLELFAEIRPVFPVFNRNLRPDPAAAEDRSADPIHLPLQKLFLDDDDDRDSPWSCSSSEEGELEAVAPGTYCVWTPRPATPSRCEKSSSTGSSATAAKRSRRWSFRDLLRRSNSEGGKSSAVLVFLTPPDPPPPSRSAAKRSEERAKDSKKATAVVSVSAHERFYVRNRKMKEEDKRRSYRPDLVGFFANVNALGRTFPPF